MCIGLPLRLTAIDGIAGHAEDDGQPRLVDLSLVPEARPGDWVLTFLDVAQEVVSAERAAAIAATLDGLRAVMAGRDPAGAFADLDSREPTLPPHLQAALAAGQRKG